MARKRLSLSALEVLHDQLAIPSLRRHCWIGLAVWARRQFPCPRAGGLGSLAGQRDPLGSTDERSHRIELIIEQTVFPEVIGGDASGRVDDRRYLRPGGRKGERQTLHHCQQQCKQTHATATIPAPCTNPAPFVGRA